MHPFVFYKCDKASHGYDYPSFFTLGIPCYEIVAGSGVQELPCKSDSRGHLLAGQGLLRLGYASLTEECYALPLQIVHVLLEVHLTLLTVVRKAQPGVLDMVKRVRNLSIHIPVVAKRLRQEPGN
jgi:hypothetical protein